MKKIYCAGPLFNNKEREEMQEIATVLEQAGFNVFLPHRDGFEFANLSAILEELMASKTSSNQLLQKAIFTLDVYQVLSSDGLVLNMNGRVPDEGAMVEAGIAWNAGKTIVIYKDDSRSLINGEDNPLLLGLSNFVTTSDISTIPLQFKQRLKQSKNTRIDNSHLEELYKKGEIIAKISRQGNAHELCQRLLETIGKD
jgi:nucleoside 2-deoxyribosyltransferase